jgi:hypothetical protein
VERNSITLAVDDDGAQTERTNGLLRLHKTSRRQTHGGFNLNDH